MKQELNQAIEAALASKEFLSEQAIGAMRKRKLPLETVVKLLHTMTGGSLKRELSNSGIEVSASAFSQRRDKIPPAVFEDAYHAVYTAKQDGFLVVGVYDSHESRQQELMSLADVFLSDYFGLSYFWWLTTSERSSK